MLSSISAIASPEQQEQSKQVFDKWLEDNEVLLSKETTEVHSGYPSHEAILKRVRTIFSYALQAIGRSYRGDVDMLVDDLLLLESRLERAQSRKERTQLMEVLRPASYNIGRQLMLHGKDEKAEHMNRLFPKLVPLFCEIPIQVGDLIHTIISFPEEDFRIKLTFDHESTPQSITDRVCQEMLDRRQFTKTLTQEKVRQKILERCGAGPPYATAILTITSRTQNQSSSVSKKPKGHLSNSSKPDGREDVSLEDGEATKQAGLETSNRPLTNHAEHISKRNNRMCLDCYNVRLEVQQDMLAALTQAFKRLETQNNDLMREIFNPL